MVIFRERVAPYVLSVLCPFVVLVIFHFGFEDRIMIVPVPDWSLYDC